MVFKAKSEGFLITTIRLVYIKSDGRYAQNEWQGNYYLKIQVVIWLRMNGFMITPIRMVLPEV